MSELTKLPEAHGHMIQAEGLFLELLALLVEEDVVSEAAAIKSYARVRNKYSQWSRQ